MGKDSLTDLCAAKTDEELVALALEDQDYFACVVARYEKKLLAYILRISGFCLEDGEDILQEVFIKAYVNLNSFDRRLKFSSWIYRIAHNEVINGYRKKKARPQCALELDDMFLDNLASDLRADGYADRFYLRENIRRLMEKMEPRYREVLVLRFWEEKDYGEISDILKKPMGTVATLLSRAKRNFEKELLRENIKL